MELFRRILIESVGLQTHHIDELLKMVRIKSFDSKDFLITEGTVCSYIGFIESGLMRSFVRGKGQEFNTDFYFNNYFVSAYSSFITQQPSDHSIQALTATKLYFISLNQYNRLVAGDLEWLRLGKFLADFFLVRKCKREISFLKQTAAERMESMLEAYPGIEQMVSQFHIASYLGIKPESLSRIKLSKHMANKPELR